MGSGLKMVSDLVVAWAKQRGIVPSPGTKVTSIRPPGEEAYLVCYGGEKPLPITWTDGSPVFWRWWWPWHKQGPECSR
jgi:hypothetical protein